ncbi:DNA helicase II, partial [Tetrabaena socialis]
MSLSEEQRAFVQAAPGAHQSLQSWAGTGKTHTLTERVVRLLDLGVPPASIVITTFTVEGARECMTRLNGRMGFESGVRVGTMDSLANQWMRQYFQPPDYYLGVQEYGTMLLDYLKSPEGINIKEKVRYLIVDEFQDLSRTQLDTVM